MESVLSSRRDIHLQFYGLHIPDKFTSSSSNLNPSLYRSSVRSNSTRHDASEAARYILVLFRCLDTGEDLLDTDPDLGVTCHLLDLTDGALLVGIGEGTGFPQDVCELGLCVDVRDGDLGVESGKEIELCEHRAFGRCREN